MTDVTGVNAFVRPRPLHVILGVALVAVLIVGVVRIAVPTRAVTRLASWTFDPIAPITATPAVPLVTGKPVVLRLDTGEDSIRRLDLFMERAGVGPNPRLRVRLLDDRSGRQIASTTIPRNRIVEHGIVIVDFDEHPKADRTRIEIESLPAELPHAQLRLDGYPIEIPGFEPDPSTVPDKVEGVSVRAYGSAVTPWQRLSFMYDHALERWPAWNGFAIPIALLVMFTTASWVGGMLVANVLATTTRMQAILSTVVVLAFLAPLVRYMLHNRIG